MRLPQDRGIRLPARAIQVGTAAAAAPASTRFIKAFRLRRHSVRSVSLSLEKRVREEVLDERMLDR